MCEFCEKYEVAYDTFKRDWYVTSSKGKIVARGDEAFCKDAVKAISRRLDVV